MNNKKSLNKGKLFVVFISIAFAIYLICISALLLSSESDLIIVKQGTIYKEETVVGYIIRNEEVITNDGEIGEIIPIASEKQKVAKGESIFQYYNLNQDEIKKQINEIDVQMQEMLKSENLNVTSEIKLLESQIENILKNIKRVKNLQELTEYNKQIDNLLEKKINYIGTSNNTSSELKQIVTQRQSLESKLTENAKYALAPQSGIVSYRVDGFEDELTVNKIENLDMNYLESLNIKTGQIVTSSDKDGKVIDNFKNYLVVQMNSEDAKKAQKGDKVKIRLSTNDEINAKVYFVKDENNKKVITFEIDKMTEKLTEYRKISFDVIWSSNNGLKVPNQSILTDSKGVTYVIREKSGYYAKVPVKIEKSNSVYSIVTTYTTNELAEKGYTEDEINSVKKIRLYDEILVNPNEDYLKK